jgi:GNAT superfamily N-acetyltransferase
MTIRILQSDAEINATFELMAQMRQRLKHETFLAAVRAQQAEGYILVGGYDDSDRPVVLAGIRCARTLGRGLHVFVDDLVTDEKLRGAGHGKAMLRWIAQYARERNISHIHLDSRDTAKGFYELTGFEFNTSIPCRIEVAKLLMDQK